VVIAGFYLNIGSFELHLLIPGTNSSYINCFILFRFAFPQLRLLGPIEAQLVASSPPIDIDRWIPVFIESKLTCKSEEQRTILRFVFS